MRTQHDQGRMGFEMRKRMLSMGMCVSAFCTASYGSDAGLAANEGRNGQPASGASVPLTEAQYTKDIQDPRLSIDARQKARLGRAILQLETLADEPGAQQDFLELYKAPGDSPYKDDALLGLIKCDLARKDIQGCEARLREFRTAYQKSPLLAVAELANGYFKMKEAGDTGGAAQQLELVCTKHSGTMAALDAEMRQADLVIHGNFEITLGQIADIEKKYADKLSSARRDWLQCSRAVAHWQLGDKEQALELFQQLAEKKDCEPVSLGRAVMHVKGIKNQNSPEGAQIEYDRALRYFDTWVQRDKGWPYFYKFLSICERPWYKKWTSDPTVDVESKGMMSYRRALAAWETGDHDKATEYASIVTDDLKTTGPSKRLALFLQAYHCSHCGHFESSERQFRNFIDNEPYVASLTPQAYLELAKVQRAADKPLDAALTLDELAIAYSWRYEVKRGADLRQGLLITTPGLKAELETAKVGLYAKVASRAKRARAVALEQDGKSSDTLRMLTSVDATPAVHQHIAEVPAR